MILISIDTLRADHLGAYGYDRPTPHLDALAREGVVFVDAIVQAPWTLPSHMSLLTGLYTAQHGVVAPEDRLQPRQTMLAERLADAGYATAAFTDGAYLHPMFGYQGFDVFDATGRTEDPRAVEGIRDRALHWLRAAPRPAFLFLHTYQVHCPYDPPREHDVYSDPAYAGPVDVRGTCASDFEPIRGRMADDDYQLLVDKYDGEIRYTDTVLGSLFAEFETMGLWDDAVLVVTSDHGENFGDHRASRIGHEELYDAVLRVPLIVKAPSLPQGVRVTTQVESIDVVPTILELIGLPRSGPLDGNSLVAVAGGGARQRTAAFSGNWWSFWDDGRNAWIRFDDEMIRDDGWKAYRRPDGSVELFDLRADPGEQRNLAATRPEVALAMTERLDRWEATYPPPAPVAAAAAERPAVDGAVRDRLRALGYVD